MTLRNSKNDCGSEGSQGVISMGEVSRDNSIVFDKIKKLSQKSAKDCQNKEADVSSDAFDVEQTTRDGVCKEKKCLLMCQ